MGYLGRQLVHHVHVISFSPGNIQEELRQASSIRLPPSGNGVGDPRAHGGLWSLQIYVLSAPVFLPSCLTCVIDWLEIFLGRQRGIEVLNHSISWCQAGCPIIYEVSSFTPSTHLEEGTIATHVCEY